MKPEWEKAIEVPGNLLEGKVPGLKEKGEYQFRVIAVNKAGLSPPSDASKMQICKHKSRKCCITNGLKMINIYLTSLILFFFSSQTKNRQNESQTNYCQSWKANQIRC